MKRWTWAALILLAAVGMAAVPTDRPQDGAQVGIVSTEAILQQTPGYAVAESTFNAEMQSVRDEVQRLQTSFDSSVTAYQQQETMLSQAQRQEREQALRTQGQQLQQRSNDLQTRMQQRQGELMAPLESRIQTVIDGVRAERNLAIILDVSSPSSNVISADPAIDLTPIVIRRLRGQEQQ